MAGPNKSPNGSLPNRADSAAHAETTPGTVTESQPVTGMRSRLANRPGVHAAGEWPEAFRPCRVLPSQTRAKASDPMPFITGSTTVSVMAVATSASAALPPLSSMRSPACAASGCEVATTFDANTGMRWDQYGKSYVTVCKTLLLESLRARAPNSRQHHDEQQNGCDQQHAQA